MTALTGVRADLPAPRARADRRRRSARPAAARPRTRSSRTTSRPRGAPPRSRSTRSASRSAARSGTLVGGWLGAALRLARRVPGGRPARHRPRAARALHGPRAGARGVAHGRRDGDSVVARFMLRLPSFVHLSARHRAPRLLRLRRGRLPPDLPRARAQARARRDQHCARRARAHDRHGRHLPRRLALRPARPRRRALVHVGARRSARSSRCRSRSSSTSGPSPGRRSCSRSPGTIVGGLYLGPCFAMTQSLAKPHMRAHGLRGAALPREPRRPRHRPGLRRRALGLPHADLRRRRDPLLAPLDGRHRRRLVRRPLHARRAHPARRPARQGSA